MLDVLEDGYGYICDKQVIVLFALLAAIFQDQVPNF